jgi:hypothetical protein
VRVVQRRLPIVSPWVPVGAGLATLVALMCPWARSGRVDRSTIELLGSASALDLLDDGQKIAAVGGWFLVVVLVAASLAAVGWEQPSLGAVFALPVGPLMIAAWFAVASSPLMVRWGAPMGTVSGLTASTTAALVLLERGNGREGTRR